jgi:hypothetical protein
VDGSVAKKVLLYDFLGDLHLAQICGYKIYYDLHDMQHSAKSGFSDLQNFAINLQQIYMRG